MQNLNVILRNMLRKFKPGTIGHRWAQAVRIGQLWAAFGKKMQESGSFQQFSAKRRAAFSQKTAIFPEKPGNFSLKNALKKTKNRAAFWPLPVIARVTATYMLDRNGIQRYS